MDYLSRKDITLARFLCVCRPSDYCPTFSRPSCYSPRRWPRGGRGRRARGSLEGWRLQVGKSHVLKRLFFGDKDAPDRSNKSSPADVISCLINQGEMPFLIDPGQVQDAGFLIRLVVNESETESHGEMWKILK